MNYEGLVCSMLSLIQLRVHFYRKVTWSNVNLKGKPVGVYMKP